MSDTKYYKSLADLISRHLRFKPGIEEGEFVTQLILFFHEVDTPNFDAAKFYKDCGYEAVKVKEQN